MSSQMSTISRRNHDGSELRHHRGVGALRDPIVDRISVLFFVGPLDRVENSAVLYIINIFFLGETSFSPLKTGVYSVVPPC